MNLDKENIIKILGIESLPDERKIEIVEMATDLVQKRLVARVLENLPAEEQEEFAQILGVDDQQKLQDYMDKHVPNFADMLAEEVNKVKEELTGLAGQIDADLQ